MKQKGKFVLLFFTVFFTLFFFGSLLVFCRDLEPTGKGEEATVFQTPEPDAGANDRKQQEQEKESLPEASPVLPADSPDAGAGEPAPEIQENNRTELNRTLQGFTNQIYNYQTSERNYYEGTEVFMTPAGYEKFVPGDAGEPGADADTRQQRLILNQAEFFYRFSSSTKVHVLAKAEITTSYANEEQMIQILELEVLKQDNGSWLISDCEVLDTLYQ